MNEINPADTPNLGYVDLNAEEVLDPVDGHRITEAETWGYTDGRSRGGRPSVGESGVTPAMSLRLPSATRAAIEKLAEQSQTTSSAVIRAAVDEYLAKAAQ